MKVYNITLLDDESDIALKELPVKFIYKDSRLFGMLALLVGGGLVLAPVAYATKKLLSPEPASGVLPILAVALLFLPLFIYGLNLVKRKRETVISADMVSRSYSSMFKKDHWQEPVTQYRGILLRTDIQSTGERTSELIYALDLYHDENLKTIRLFKCKEYNTAFNKWKEYCQLFETDALERTGKDTIIQRSLNEIGKPLVDMVGENRTLIHSAPPAKPAEVEIADTPKGQMITLPNKTEISFNPHIFTVKQNKSWKNETGYEYTSVRTVLIDYVKQNDKWGWALVIVERDSSHRMVYAHDLDYPILDWLQYFLLDRIIEKSGD